MSTDIPKRRRNERRKLYIFHKTKKDEKNAKKVLAKYCQLLYNDIRCELIALKREVATQY